MRLMNYFDEGKYTIMKQIIDSNLVIEINIDGKYKQFPFSFKQFVWSYFSSIQNLEDCFKTLRLLVLSVDFKHSWYHIYYNQVWYSLDP